LIQCGKDKRTSRLSRTFTEILNTYSQRPGQSGDRILLDAKFSATFQTVLRVHRAISCVEWPGSGVDHPPHLVPRLKKE